MAEPIDEAATPLRGGRPRSAWSARLRGRADLAQSVARMVDLGTRMNALASEQVLREFLVEALTELLGARRVLLVLLTADGPSIAGSQVPAGETPDALLQAITPWLDEARRTRQNALRHGPEGAEAIDQRSCLLAPLVAGRELLGFLYADLEGVYGRFGERDLDLLVMLAGQAAQALANRSRPGWTKPGGRARTRCGTAPRAPKRSTSAVACWRRWWPGANCSASCTPTWRACTAASASATSIFS